MIDPDWDYKKRAGLGDVLGRFQTGYPGEVTENLLLRLAFHDCIPYDDDTGAIHGGCDGCLNWDGMYASSPNPNTKKYYTFEIMFDTGFFARNSIVATPGAFDRTPCEFYEKTMPEKT